MKNCSIDLNADLGEGASNDAEVLRWVSSANIACGGHAGDAVTMRHTVQQAREAGVAVGGHPGYADREAFGRREWPPGSVDVAALIREQVGALRALCEEEGVPLCHVKPHGALYTQSARDAVLASALAQAVRAIDPGLILVGLAGSRLLEAGRALGLSVAAEGFADRGYADDGGLLPRGLPGAMLADPGAVVAQGLRLAREGRVWSVGGLDLKVQVDTLCLHGDGPHAALFARRLRQALDTERVFIIPMGSCKA